MIIGITGGSGCGKTTLLQIIADKGGLILDCDAIYHHLLKTDQALLTAIETRFPGVTKEGELDRKALGEIVFADEKALLDLNRITHEAVRQEVLRQLASSPKLAAIDAIGLFEGGLAPLCDVTAAVFAPEETRIRRLMDRDGISESYARKRIAAQHTHQWFRERCDHALYNDGTPEQFREKCLAFLHSLGIM
ncbi:MAG: dephospho-CoA kinase [Ruminococcaceae bacterium]|nr:dephospho-CoA kinase [Oscillospiraceae bacterium]